MREPERDELLVSGVGITTAVGQGRVAVTAALLEGRHRFGLLQRPGRQRPAAVETADAPAAFIGAEIPALELPASISRSLLRTVSLSGQAALATLHEAWNDAALDQVDPERIGLVVGGSNFQQRELALVHDAYRGREAFLRPTYGVAFMDSDLCGLCSEVFGIRGFACTVGGASASGQVAVIQAINAVLAGQVDVCIALGALMDLSYWECQGLRSIGAMGSDRHADDPARACRPFDADRDGFVFGEACGAVVIERAGTAARRGVLPYAQLAGWAMGMDANRNPNPALDGEVRAITLALQRAGLDAAQIDYVNPHGTGSGIGDTTEVETLRRCGLQQAWLNTTKSILGHGLCAAGAVELVAVLLQLREGRLHPCRNMDTPIAPDLHWTGTQAVSHKIHNALNLSLGFGGVNTAVCLRQL